MSSKESPPLHILFFPFMAPGHFQPLLHMAELFSARGGVRVSLLTTPANVSLVRPSLNRSKIELHTVPFPSAEAGLPEGCENYTHVPSPDLLANFYAAMPTLRDPFHKVLRDLLPDCVVTDTFFYWSYAAAAELNIPRLVFPSTCLFSMCAHRALRSGSGSNSSSSSSGVVIPGLPHRIEMLRSQLPPSGAEEPEIFKLVTEADAKSYGAVVNTFFELESDYLDCLGRKAWPVGPVAPRDRDDDNADDDDNCVKWLDRESPGSVVYVCFGSTGGFTRAQVRELALGLEACNRPFVWVVGKDFDDDEWVPRVGGKGLIVRGWAPQVRILNHPSVGGFVTHCGWNSCLEGVTAGVPLATWPMHVEQFYNERSVVDVLGIGVSVGVRKLAFRPEDRDVVDAGTVRKAVDELMGSGEAAELRRRRARELGEKARGAVEEGGSSYVNVTNLIQELIDNRNSRVVVV